MRLPFLTLAGLRQAVADVVLVVGGDALQAADRHRLLLDPSAPAGRLAGAVAGAPENPRKHVRLPVDHVGVAVATRGDQPDVFGDGRVRRARPLAIHDLVEVVGRSNVGIFHLLLGARAPVAPIQTACAGRSRPVFVVRLVTPNPGGNLAARGPKFHRCRSHNSVFMPRSLIAMQHGYSAGHNWHVSDMCNYALSH